MSRIADPVTVLRGHDRPVTSVCLLPSDHILSGSDEGTMKLWNLQKNKEVFSAEAHTARIVSLDHLSGTASRFISHGRDGIVKIWDIRPSDITLEGQIFTESIHFCNSCTLQNSEEETHLVCCPSHDESVVSHSIFSMIIQYYYFVIGECMGLKGENSTCNGLRSQTQ